MNKTLPLLLSLFCAHSLNAQVFKADTAFVTDVSTSGKPVSCAFNSSINSTYGLNHNRNFYFLLGEDFVVPTGQTWNLDTVIVYSYQTGSGTSPSPINFATLQIRQSSVSGSVVFGDTTTNRLATSNWTGIYRVDKNDLNGTTRPIMAVKIKLTPTKTLTAGTYWMIWGCKGSGTGGVFCPMKTASGRTNPAGQNAMQLSNKLWHSASDTFAGPQPVTVGFNYILKGPQKPSGGVGIEAYSMEDVMLQNVPNPFTGSTDISFFLPQAGQVQLRVHNTLGQHVATLIDSRLPAGRQEVNFDASGLAAGKYFYRLQTESGSVTRSMEIIK